MQTIIWNEEKCFAHSATALTANFRITLAADWGALWDYAELIQNNSLAVYGDLLPLFRQSNLNIVNVECALGTIGEPVVPKANLRSTKKSASSLSAVPFHIACLANNHVMDFGPESLAETIEILRYEKIQTVGAGLNGHEAAKPLILPMKDGATLGIINCAMGELSASINNGPGANPLDVVAIRDHIYKLKSQVDAVLVIFHGGAEFTPVPSPRIVATLRHFVDAGASAVIAHHPHVPQGVEIYQGVPIAYSQGNFVFRSADTRQTYRHFLNIGYLVHLDFSGGSLVEFSLSPYEMRKEGVFLLKGDKKQQFLKDLKKVSDLLADEKKVEQAWAAYVDDYGLSRLLNILRTRIDMMDSFPAAGAMLLLNCFHTDHERYTTALQRVFQKKAEVAPGWAKDLLRDWLERPSR